MNKLQLGSVWCLKIQWSLARRVALALIALAGAGALNATPPALKVVGNQLVTDAGQPVRLRGVNCAGLEWASDGNGRIVRTVEVAVVDWHANLIRLPLSQDRWFGQAPEQKDGGAAYRALVAQLVEFCAAHNAYILLDLHWSDTGVWGKNIGQHNLPDRNSIVFWTDCAPRFADNPAVLFDLYNEPARIDWDQWYKGGPITETDHKTRATLSYDSVGLPALAAAIRATGAKNVIVAGGINWAYELEGIPGGREIKDPTGRGVVYAVHPYPHKYEHLGWETLAQWAARMEKFAAKLPLIVTEFGSDSHSWPTPKEWQMTDEKWNREMLRTLEAHQWNWTAWDFHDSARPCLIADWSYTPTPEFGVWVKETLAANVAGAK